MSDIAPTRRGRPPQRLLVAVTVTGAVLVAVSLVLPRITPWDVLDDPSSPIVHFIDVRAEANLHTWFNVAVLTVGALVHACVGVLARRAGSVVWPWGVLSGALALLALDDLASLHEKLAPLGRAMGGGGGALHFAWIVPGAALAVGLIVTAVTVARRLPRASARWLLGGITALVAAAVGAEALGGILLGADAQVSYALVSHTEEFVETVAAGMLLCSAVAALSVRCGSRPGSVEIRYDTPPAAAARAPAGPRS